MGASSSTEKYSILSLRDISNSAVKRYSANILLHKKPDREKMNLMILEINNHLKTREYYKNDIAKERWEGTKAQVISLFIYISVEDVRVSNWFCRSLWIRRF